MGRGIRATVGSPSQPDSPVQGGHRLLRRGGRHDGLAGSASGTGRMLLAAGLDSVPLVFQS